MSIDARQAARNRHWSDQAANYHDHWQTSSVEGSLYKELEAKLMVEFSQTAPGKKILDLCSGTGRNTLALARTGARLWGIDGAPGMVQQAAENAHREGLDNVTFLEGDARSLPFPNEMFDAVTGTRFMYMMKPEERRRIVAEVRRVLKPNGIAVLQFNCGFWGIKKEISNLLAGRRFRLRYRYFWPGHARRLFQGFRVETVAGVKFPRLALLSRLLGKRTAASLNQVVRWPGFCYFTSYLLVRARKI